MLSRQLWIGTFALAFFVQSSPAEACGGFFCGQLPVDQTAERILFEVGDGTVTMTTQIAFNGAAPDFAWILPLPEVPDPESLAVFPQRALTALDANTGPLFFDSCFAAETAAGGGTDDSDGVTVHIRAEVGDYEVAVIESADPTALIDWLRAEAYRVTEPMEPYIELYTNEGMKFLALKLNETADVNDIKPFRFTLPGDVPSIPLRMTALAAEPEMSIVVLVLGDQRYEAKNWQNIEIDDADIVYDPFNWPLKTNWGALVAQGVDEAGGQGWVTEFAGGTEGYIAQLEAQIEIDNFQAPEDREAALALLEVLEPHPYLTRLYTRVSAEEMTVDPIFGRSAGGDVAREHQLMSPDGVDQCVLSEPDPCDFVTCGAGGICRTVALDAGMQGAAGAPNSGSDEVVAGCGCVPGATARTTFAPDGSATVICQDQRMSFINPGDQEAGMETLPDPCATFDCGEHGSCVAMNMTPTCVCNQGYVAVGSFDASGQRRTSCVEPQEPIEATFYDGRLPELPAELPGGRVVDMPEPGSGGGTTSGSAGTSSGSGGTGDNATTSSGSGGSDASSSGGTTAEPMEDAAASEDEGCSCRVVGKSRQSGSAWWLVLGVAGIGAARRRWARGA